jgi:hypothetical protein
LKARLAFDEISERVAQQPDLVRKLNAVIVFDISKDNRVQQSWSESIESIAVEHEQVRMFA